MSTDYALLKKVTASALFDGSLEKFGVREHAKPDGTSKLYWKARAEAGRLVPPQSAEAHRFTDGESQPLRCDKVMDAKNDTLIEAHFNDKRAFARRRAGDDARSRVHTKMKLQERNLDGTELGRANTGERS
jgi:hypothetical protein